MKFKHLTSYSEFPWPGVLLLHGSHPVVNSGDLFHQINTSTGRIQKLITSLKSQFEIIDENQFLELADNGFKKSEGKFLVTFDDAYRNVYTELFDFFETNKIKPLIFFVAGFMKHTHLNWPAVITMFLRQTKQKQVVYNNIPYLIDTAGNRFILMTELMNDAKTIPHLLFKERLNETFLFDQYLDKKQHGYDEDMLLMSDQQVEKIIKAGWGIGSHSLSHFPLTSFDAKGLEIEIKESKKILEDHYGAKIHSIAYPHGDYNAKVITCAKESYKLGFAAQPFKQIKSNYEIPRFSLPGDEGLVRDIVKLPVQRKQLFLDKKSNSGFVKSFKNSVLISKLLLNEPIDRALLFQKIINKLSPAATNLIENKGIDLGSFEDENIKTSNLSSKTRVMIICAADSPMRKLVSELSKSVNIAGVIIQNLGNYNIKVIKSSLNNSSFSATENIAPYLFPYFRFDNQAQQIILGYESLAWFTAQQTRVFQCSDINDEKIPDIISSVKPDIIFVSGTKMIKNQFFFESGIPVLNLHTGVSPYYRGSYTLKWPIFNNDSSIGITVHQLNSGIDSGAIVAHQKVELDGTETTTEIFYKAFIEEIIIIKKIVSLMDMGEKLILHEQDLNKGKLYLAKDWTEEHERIVTEKLENGFIYNTIYSKTNLENKNLISLKQN